MILDRGLCANRKRMVSLCVHVHPIAGCEWTKRLSKTNDNINPVIYPAAIDQGLCANRKRMVSLFAHEHPIAGCERAKRLS